MNASINIEGGKLHNISNLDRQFICDLFKTPDIKKYFVLRDDHKNNLNEFVDYMIDCSVNRRGFNYIIKDLHDNRIGLITAEIKQCDGEVYWNIGYAIDPRFRNRGYATSALNELSKFLLNNFSVSMLSLDICQSNTSSQNIATRCGFKLPNNKVAYFDTFNIDLEFRQKWYKFHENMRAIIFNQAMHAHRTKQYHLSIELYKKSLLEEFDPQTPFSDAQIYSNLGIANTAVGNYQDAFSCLMKAKSLGLTNQVIEKELIWLKNNVGLG